ncbi:MAG TPA: hypothetical protein VJI97_02555 [Candidatus Nanoarchaeia archaeon]|nr:hypothetical protein [Candidatus Nanoarchaeia archaeon]
MGCNEEKCDETKDSCCETDSCCEDSKCGCEGKCDCTGDNMAVMVMGLANDAWSKLMKEKMKAAYEKAIGPKMDRMAQVGVEACIAYWNNQMKDKAAFAEFEEKLKKAML